jgi:hypothetical protein
VAAVLLLLLPGATLAHKVGLRIGDRATYSVTLITTVGGYPKNTSSSYTTQFSIEVLNISTAGPVGLVGYSLSIDLMNGSSPTTTSPPTQNVSTIFDPSDNVSYIGSGFFPFIYTDLGNQTNVNVPVSYPVNGSLYPPYPTLVNSSVVTTAKGIFVSVQHPLAPNATIYAYWFMRYNATNGLLLNSTVLISQFGTSRDFYYKLLDYSYVPPSVDEGTLLPAYLAVVVVAVIVVVGLIAIARKPSRKARTVAKVKERYRRR